MQHGSNTSITDQYERRSTRKMQSTMGLQRHNRLLMTLYCQQETCKQYGYMSIMSKEGWLFSSASPATVYHTGVVIMGQITLIEYDGTATVLDIEAGKSLMQLAIDHGVSGIDGDCGGECACGTCHVIVDGAWLAATGQPNDEEARMLEMVPEGTASSRLACQIQLSDAMDGMVVHLPEFQM
jgi:2Fe-2S ferredoxin